MTLLIEEFSTYGSMQGLLSDMHKDAYGYRPRGIYSVENGWTIAAMMREVDRLGEVIEHEMNEEEKWRNENLKDLEKRIQELVQMGAGTRETAIRWYLEGLDIDLGYCGDFHYIIWKLRIPHNCELAKEFVNVAQEGFQKQQAA